MVFSLQDLMASLSDTGARNFNSETFSAGGVCGFYKPGLILRLDDATRDDKNTTHSTFIA